jgi:hypothetical protein
MSHSRRDFLKTTALASASAALGGSTLWARPVLMRPSVAENAADASLHGLPGAFTRGLGDYPGLPAENFNPLLVPADESYRNLALLRPAFHSSAYDYNLTAQLVTDGLRAERRPDCIAMRIAGSGLLPRTERENLVDHFLMEPIEISSAVAEAEIELEGEQAPEVDRIEIACIAPKMAPAQALRFQVAVSDDGRNWEEAGSVAAPQPASTEGFPPNFAGAGVFCQPSIVLNQPRRSRFYRVQCAAEGVNDDAMRNNGAAWRLAQIAFYRATERIQIGGPYSFTSAWRSEGLGEEWVSIDLGVRCRFDRIKLFWIARAAEGVIQISDDNVKWTDLVSIAGSQENSDDFRLDHPAEARYLRVLMRRPVSEAGYILSEVEVWGRGGLVARPRPAQKPTEDGHLNLAGGNWRLQRGAQVEAAAEALSRPGFDDAGWLVATVPGTVLTSYFNAGAIPDPNYGQNQLQISDSFFYSDFWYRNEFVAPASAPGKRIWLDFDGVNWKAEVWLNGEKLGRVEGGFTRGRFDVTSKLLPGKSNALAVRIEKNATPGSVHQKTLEHICKNGGALGADNPTYHASAGWDWIPTMRGRNIGIWGDVALRQTGAVTIENPFAQTVLPLPEISSAEVRLELDLVNHQASAVSGLLRGSYGEARFEQRVTLAVGERRTIRLNASTHPALRLKEPKLWWPAGYGEAHLYDVVLSFVSARGVTLDQTSFRSGVRQMSYSEEGGDLRIWINGRRFIPRGGNWGFAESMLRYRAREYDAAVRYHREMNFTMIRNWVGQIGDDAFYEACDRHGVMVWQDFWLANPWDGPEPRDNALFLANAHDLVLRIRNHAALGLYCGRNEGFPPPQLEAGLRKILGDLHPGLHYIPSSADEGVSGHGPYDAKPPAFYFRNADHKLHSEIGAPAIPPIESVRLMMPEKVLWPQGLDWGLHDFCLDGAQGGAGFRKMLEDSFGSAPGAEEWIELAQFINYESYRAMFEAQSRHRMGVLLWMSHSCWPSFVWQTYDYYFEPTAAYYGCRKGSEPLHIQWNRDRDTIEVVNYSAGNHTGLSASIELINLDGRSMAKRSLPLDSREDSTTTLCSMEWPASLSAVHFLRLTLNQGDAVLSSNFYLRGREEGNYRALRKLPRVRPAITTRAELKGETWLLTTDLHNATETPALMVRIKAVREHSGDRILPAIYSDNYIALMPGESRTLTTEIHLRDTRGEKPVIVLA